MPRGLDHAMLIVEIIHCPQGAAIVGRTCVRCHPRYPVDTGSRMAIVEQPIQVMGMMCRSVRPKYLLVDPLVALGRRI